MLDLIPVVSWVVHRGRCRTCKSKIPYSYVVFELLLGIVFALAYQSIGLVSALPVFLAFIMVLDFIVLYDLRHTIVPISSMVVLAVLGVLFAFLKAGSLTLLTPSLIAAAVIAFVFFALYALSRGRAMGLGDAPVAFALSVGVGFPASLAGTVFSFWIGAVIGIALLLLSRGRTTMKSEIPFVPFLAIGYLLAFFTGWNPFFLIS